jgi:hypothetical protein
MAALGVPSYFKQSRSGKAEQGKKATSAHFAEANSAGAEERTDMSENEVEKSLRRFDLDQRFGPCTGLTRRERCAPLSPRPEAR